MSDEQDSAPEDAVTQLLKRLADQQGSRVPTGVFSRLRRTAGAGLRTGLAALTQRGRSEGSGLGALGPETIEQLVMSLGELKGIAMKVGQMLGYIDDTLPSETRRLLAILQVRSQPTSFDEVERIMREDLKDRAIPLIATITRTPASTASIGQVHRARLPDGTPVAVKVRHPGIEEAIRADFRTAVVGKTIARLVMPGANVGDVVAEAEARFLEECDYHQEALHQMRFYELYAKSEALVVPAVHLPWSGARVLTTTWWDGRGFEDLLAQKPSGEVINRIGQALYEFYVGSLYRYGLFNADPHPGNLLFPADGRVVVLDYGCVRVFDRAIVRTLAQLSRAVRDDDMIEMQSAMESLGARPHRDAIETTRALLRSFFAPVLIAGSHRMEAPVDLRTRQVFQSKRAMLRLRLPGKLLFLFRIRFGLYAVLSRLGADLDWRSLEECLTEIAEG